jgi:NAD(P)-dependent dehydrogenase (short-subunit alcohol dehydrogenase family)
MPTWTLPADDTLVARARKLTEIVFAGGVVAPEVVAAAAAHVAQALEIYAAADARNSAMAGVPVSLCIREAAGLPGWDGHRFGLAPERWQSLAGRVVWITGGGTGYGRAVAVALSLAGARVALSGRRPGVLEDTAAEIRRRAPDARVAVLPMDVTDADAAAAAVASLRSQLGEMDGLVCAAALPGNPGPVLGMADGELRHVLDVNVLGQIVPCRAAVPAMAGQGRGRVVLFSSEAAWGFPPGLGIYNLTKAAVNGLGASMATEIAAYAPGLDVQVNVVDPGEAHTEMNYASAVSPYSVCSMVLTLLAQPPGGPSGRFFHRDGRHLSYGAVPAWPLPLG